VLYSKPSPDAAHADEPELFQRNGWRVRHALEVASTPERYRAYIQVLARGVQLRQVIVRRVSKRWISDRTLCNLASGKAVVLQDTGPSSPCPPVKACFSTIEEVVEALTTINGDYERPVLPEILNLVDARA
jgi:hypothetical protein